MNFVVMMCGCRAPYMPGMTGITTKYPACERTHTQWYADNHAKYHALGVACAVIPGVPKKWNGGFSVPCELKVLYFCTSLDKASSAEENDTKIIKFG